MNKLITLAIYTILLSLGFYGGTQAKLEPLRQKHREESNQLKQAYNKIERELDSALIWQRRYCVVTGER